MIEKDMKNIYAKAMKFNMRTLAVILLSVFLASCDHDIDPIGMDSENGIAFKVDISDISGETAGVNAGGSASSATSQFVKTIGKDSIFLSALHSELHDGLRSEVPSSKVTPYKDAIATTESFGFIAYTYKTLEAELSTWKRFCAPTETKYVTTKKYWEPTTKMYWPLKDEYIRFFAYAPYKDGAGNVITVASSDTEMPKISITVNSDVSEQVDLLVADSQEFKDNASSSVRNAIKMEFSHMMTGIAFKAKKSLAVKSIEVSGVYDKADLQLAKKAKDAEWSGLTKSGNTYTLTSLTGTEEGDYIIYDPKFTMMMIPQSLPNDPANSENGAKIVVTLDDDSKIECSLAGHIWERNKLVTYIISDEPVSPRSYYLQPLTDAQREQIVPTDDQPHTVNIELNSYWDGDSKLPVDCYVLYAEAEYGPFYQYDNIPSTSKIKDMIESPATISSTGTLYSISLPIKANTMSSGGTAQRKQRKTALENRGVLSDTDLSMWDFTIAPYGGSRTIPCTANSYVIRQKGTYMLPCVYGNAIGGTTAESTEYSDYDNVEAYKPNGGVLPDGVNASKFLLNFKNSFGGDIQNPFLHLDAGVMSGLAVDLSSPMNQSKSEVAATAFKNSYEAVLVWCDLDSEDAESTNFVTVHNEITDALLAGSESLGNIPYVKFTVGSGIQEANMLIAVREKTSKQIVWSWHIWVTAENDLTPLDVEDYNYMHGNPGGNINKLLPVPLGWNAEESVAYYPEREIFCKIVQKGSLKTSALIRVFQAYQIDKGDLGGSSTFYQWGRKDPLIPNRVSFSTVVIDETLTEHNTKHAYIKKITTDSYSRDDIVASNYDWMATITPSGSSDLLQTSIQYPYKFIKTTWTDYLNLWDAGQTVAGEDREPIKTVYDPCPPGFKVPRKSCFTGFSLRGNFANEDRIDLQSDMGEDGYYYKAAKAVGIYCKKGSSDRTGILMYTQSFYFNTGAFVKDRGQIGWYWTACRTETTSANAMRININPATAERPFAQIYWPGGCDFGRSLMPVKDE